MTSSAPIFRELLSEEQRAAFVSKNFGVRFLWIESFAFDTASGISEDYDGGYWHYYALSNGGFYMAPGSGELFRVVADNGYEGDISADAFGIVCCLYTYSLLSGSPDEIWAERCAAQYHLLLPYAAEHRESRVITAVID